MKKILLIIHIVVLLGACKGESASLEVGDLLQTEKDIFKTVTIGNQVWMRENLSSVSYRNGDPIIMLEPDDFWRQTTTGAWCYYNNDSIHYAKYGALYNWHAINDPRGICPEGWRVPTLQDYTTLIEYLGTDSTSGDFLKDTSSVWFSSNGMSTNTSGFSALPNGYRLGNGDFLNFGKIACFWTATPGDDNNAWDIFLLGKSGIAGKSQTGFEHGYSCRCIKE